MVNTTETNADDAKAETTESPTPTRSVEQSSVTNESTDDASKPKAKRKAKGGAPKGNRNAMKHGFSSGFLPTGCGHITRQASTFRKVLEASILDVRGQMGVYEVASVQTAVEYHQHALKVRRWLRIADEELSHDQRINYSREIAKAFESRDRILKNLGLDQKAGVDETAIDALYARVPVIRDQEPTTAVEPDNSQGN